MTAFDRLCAMLTAVLLCLVSACGSSPTVSPIPVGAVVDVKPVRNLSGVTLRVPELWLGDASEQAAALDIELIDLRLLAEAGLRARLLRLGHELDGGAEHEVHAAITRFEMTEMRRTGRITLGLAVMVVNDGVVTLQSEVVQDCQLLDRPPTETGIVGEQRFIRRRLELFLETLARETLLRVGL